MYLQASLLALKRNHGTIEQGGGMCQVIDVCRARQKGQSESQRTLSIRLRKEETHSRSSSSTRASHCCLITEKTRGIVFFALKPLSLQCVTLRRSAFMAIIVFSFSCGSRCQTPLWLFTVLQSQCMRLLTLFQDVLSSGCGTGFVYIRIMYYTKYYGHPTIDKDEQDGVIVVAFLAKDILPSSYSVASRQNSARYTTTIIILTYLLTT